MAHDQDESTNGVKTYILFGDTEITELESLLQTYVQPQYFDTLDASLSWGIAGSGTGVPFHRHGAVFNEVIYGYKRWFLYPPDVEPHFDGKQTTLHWLKSFYSSPTFSPEFLQECVLGPNEVLYVPDDWWHATLNVGQTVNIATFAKLSLLKRHLYAAPFLKAIEKKASDIITFSYRPEENVYIKSDADRITVIFDIQFRDADDIVFSKIFLQEFADTRRTINQAPAVSFSQKDPPLELKGVKGVKAGENNGFVSFVLFQHHITEKDRDRTLDLIQTFRDYLHYHIKCSKAYMHMRMRTRVETLLQILNRAKPEPVDNVKRTVTGKTFKRAGQNA